MRIPASVQFGDVLQKALGGPVAPVDPEAILEAVVEKAGTPEGAKRAWEKRERAKAEAPKAEAPVAMTPAHVDRLSDQHDQAGDLAGEAESAHTAGQSDLDSSLRYIPPDVGTVVEDERQYGSAIENFPEAAEQ